MKKNKNKKRNRIIVIAIIIIIIILIAISQLTKGAKDNTDNDLGKNDVTIVSSESLSDTISAKGVVQSKKINTVLANSTLEVVTVNVEVGDKVNKGDVLAVLDASELEKTLNTTLQSNSITVQTQDLTYEQQIQALKDTIEAGKESNDTIWEQWVASANIDPELHEKLGQQLASNNATRFEAQDTLDQVEGRKPVTSSAAKSIILSKATNNNTKATLANSADSLRQQIEDATIVAPASGTITSANLQVGNYANSVAFVIQDLDDLEVVSSINERDFSSVDEGLKTIVTSDAIKNVTYEGKVSLIAPVATSVATNTVFSTTIDIENEDGQIRPGMNAKVKYVLFEEEGVLSVPLDAVVYEDDKTYVYVLNQVDSGYQAKKVEVTTGKENDINITITSGIKANDLVMNYPSNYDDIDNMTFDYEGNNDGE